MMMVLTRTSSTRALIIRKILFSMAKSGTFQQNLMQIQNHLVSVSEICKLEGMS